MLLKKRLSGLLMLLSMGVFVALWAGCGSDGSSLPADVADAQTQLTSATEDPTGLYGVDMLASDVDQKASLGEIQKTSETSGILFDGYGRRIKITRQSFDFVKSEDGNSAIATITFLISGNFVIRTKDSVTSIKTIMLKPIEQVMTRKVHFTKNADTTVARRWIADSLTPAYGISKNGTLSLTGVSITIRNGVNVQTYTFSDPLDFWVSKGSLPTVHQGDTILVTEAIANSDAADKPFGFIHRGEPKAAVNAVAPRARFKHFFNDAGVNGDAVAGDGTFTARFVIASDDFVGHHVAVLDFFTTSTLAPDATKPYNALTIIVPYQKQ